jgi:very-short-patch-repair endonuclease
MIKFKHFDYDVTKKHARELRKNQTDSEKLLWQQIKGRKLSGYKFLRQHPIIYRRDPARISYFVADFYCNEKRAIIELDGPVHDASIDYDQFRDSELQNLGIHILRIKNEELTNMPEVLNKIIEFLAQIR